MDANSWLSEMGMDDPSFGDQFDILDFFDEEMCAAIGDDFLSCLSPPGNSNSSTFIPRSSSTTTLCTSPPMNASPVALERPAKQHKSNNYNSLRADNMPNLEQPSSSPIILCFGNPNSPELNPQQVNLGTLGPEEDAASEVLNSQGSFQNLEEPIKTPRATKKSSCRIRPPSQTYDHIIAERKRRELLSQRFVALSAIVPGLKKMDKTSVLGDAIKYLKHLQDRVKTLEEQATKQTMESMVFVKKSQLFVEDEGSSDEMGSTDEQPLPEIEAKMCDKTILLRVHCEKNKGVLVKVLSEIEEHNLVVTNTNVAPFGGLALDITIIAEMEKEFNMTMKELVKALRSALQRPNPAE